MPEVAIQFDPVQIEKALALLVKAGAHVVKHRGPNKRHKYIRRTWNSARNRWDYVYHRSKHGSGKHGHRHSYSKGDHSVDIHHDSRHLDHTPEQAYNHRYLVEQLGLFKRKIARAGRANTTVHFKDINGTDLFTAEHHPRRTTKPVTILHPHGKAPGEDRVELITMSAFEGMVRGLNRRVYYDDKGNPLAYAMRVNMKPEFEEEYHKVNTTRSRARSDWRQGPKPVKVVFFEDNEYAIEHGWAGKSTYIPHGDKLHQFITERLTLLRMRSVPQRGNTKVVNPGVTSAGVLLPKTRRVEEGSIGWTSESVKQSHSSRKRIVRKFDLEGKFSTKKARNDFLFAIQLEHLRMGLNTQYKVLATLRSQGVMYDFDERERDIILDAILGRVGDKKRTGLIAALDHYNPYKVFENPETGERRGCKFLTHAVSFMRRDGNKAAWDIVHKRNVEKREISADEAHKKRNRASLGSSEWMETQQEIVDRIDDFADWKRAQKAAIQKKLRQSMDSHEVAVLGEAKEVLNRIDHGQMDDFYGLISDYDWAIPPDDPSLYKDYQEPDKASRDKAPAPSKVDLPDWIEFVTDNLEDDDEIAALTFSMPDGPSFDIDPKQTRMDLTRIGVLDKNQTRDERDDKTSLLIRRGMSKLQLQHPSTVNAFFSRAEAARDTKKSIDEELLRSISELSGRLFDEDKALLIAYDVVGVDAFFDLNKAEAWEMSPDEFMDYHQTGFIPSDAYGEKGDEHFSLWKKEKHPVHIGSKTFGPHEIEFRQTGTPNRYTYFDRNTMQHKRDDEGNLLYRPMEEVKQLGWPTHETSVVAFHGDKAIGYASDEFGTDGVWMHKDYQKMGIGTHLLGEFRKQFPAERKMGQMTSAGYKTAQKYHKQQTQQTHAEGKPIHKESAAMYGLGSK